MKAAANVFLLALLTACTAPIQQVSESGFGAFEADLEILDSNTIAVAWYDTRHGQAEIYLRLLSSDLDPVSAEYRLTDSITQSYEADVVGHQGNLAVTWYEVNQDGAATVWLGMWSRAGELLWRQAITDQSVDARIPVIESLEDRLFIAWLQDADTVVAAWIDTNSPLDPEIEARFEVAPASSTTWNLNSVGFVSETRAEVLLAFDAEFETATSELYLSRITGRAVVSNRLTSDDGYPSKYPDLAVQDNNEVALTWFDNVFGNNEVFLVAGQIDNYFSSATSQFMELGATRVSRTDGDSIGAYVSWQGAGPVVAWSDNDSGQYEIYRQAFEADGKPLSDMEQLTASEADSLIPSIAAIAGFLCLSWNEVTVNSHALEDNLSRSEVVATCVEYSR